MKLFSADSFLDIAVTSLQAVDIAEKADRVMSTNSFVLYGRYENGNYYDFSTIQKPEHTHAILGYAPKALRNKTTGI